MAATPRSIFDALSDAPQWALLSLHNQPVQAGSAPPPSYADLSLGPGTTEALTNDLQKISLLGLSENAALLRNVLLNLKCTPEELHNLPNGRDRACHLLRKTRDDFERAIEIYDGNRLVLSETHEAGFELPLLKLGFAEPEALDDEIPKDHPLFAATEKTLKEHLGIPGLILLHMVIRSDISGSTSDARVAQFGFSHGDEPQQVETAVDGEEVIQGISFLSRLVVVIDFNAGTIFITAKTLKRK